MKVQLLSLASLAISLSVGWLPGAILRIRYFGLVWPYIQIDDSAGQTLPGLGRRLELAYRHLLVNFSPFGATVMILAKMDVSDMGTLTACWTFTLARIAHFTLYAIDFPQARALCYVLSLCALFFLSWRAIGCLLSYQCI